MKKIFFAFIAMFSMAVEAQNINDAVRYSTSDLSGTARFRSMSGAFGALGGDLSSLDVNPAGSAVFLNSFASFSLDLRSTENDVSYFNGFTNSSNSNVNLGQGGAVFVFNSRDEGNPWRKFTLGINYSTTKNFENDFIAAGTGNNSIDDYFLGYANGIPLDFLEPLEDESIAELYSYLGQNEGFGAQQAMLGYQGFIINSTDPGNFESTTYTSAIAPGNFDQEYAYAATGLNGKFSFNFATQFQENLYLGLNLNSHFINYEKTTSYFEANSNPGSEINEVYFENNLSTLGSGFSFQVGGIAKLGSSVRVGASYESPTWYNISEETTEYLETFSNEFGEAVVNPNVINIYPEYKLQTPGKYTGSVAVLFGTNGLLSFDYSYKDYSSTKFKPTSEPEFAFQNDLMADQLKGASTYRLGGEYRLQNWSLRGGYRIEESPFSNDNLMGDLKGYSAGIGYNFGNIKLDLAYDQAQQERSFQLFPVGLTDSASIDEEHSNFTLTLSFGI